MSWDGAEQSNVWQHNTGIEPGVHDDIDEVSADPIMRMHIRSSGFEGGTHTVRTADNLPVPVPVTLD
jgi:hypothetical protein